MRAHIIAAIKSNARGIARKPSRKAVLILLLAAQIPAIAVLSSHFVMFREDLQTILFPIAALSIYLIFREFKLGLPSTIYVVASIFWLAGALNVRGYLPNLAEGVSIFVSRLDSDPTTIRARQLVSEINLVSRQYQLSRATLLHRSFASDQEVANWLRAENTSALVIRGSPNWPRVVFDGGFQWIVDSSESDSLPKGVETDLRRQSYSLSLSEGAQLLKPEGMSESLVVIRLPEAADLPAQPIELSQHYLAWLGNAFDAEGILRQRYRDFFGAASKRSVRTAVEEQIAIAELRSSFLHLASDVQGDWRSSEPRALALLLRGTKELIEAGITNFNNGSLDCAIGLLSRAQRILQAEHAAEVFAAVNNNLAVACLLHSSRPFSCQLLASWLRDAAEMVDENGHPVRGAVAAQINLLALSREGIF